MANTSQTLAPLCSRRGVSTVGESKSSSARLLGSSSETLSTSTSSPASWQESQARSDQEE